MVSCPEGFRVTFWPRKQPMGAVPKSETFLIQKKKENETGKKLNLGLCCGQICYFKYRFQSFFKVLYVSLGQIKPKAGLVHNRFSQRTKELDLFAMKSQKANKTNSFFCFFGRIYGSPICFRFHLTFNSESLFY